LNAVELRTLDGPNLFMMRPAMKLEIAADPDETACLAQDVASRSGIEATRETGPEAIARLAGAVVTWIAGEVGMPLDELVTRVMEQRGHVAVAWSWERRQASRAVGHLAWKLVAGDPVEIDRELDEIRALLATPDDRDDLPEMIADSDRRIPTIGITGTNGKTTTTRLIASILRNAGNSVAWTSSSGVVVNGEMVLSGDYTGPRGAHRCSRSRASTSPCWKQLAAASCCAAWVTSTAMSA